MSWRHVSRADLLQRLEEATRGPVGIQDLRRWLRQVLVDDDIEVDESASPLIHTAVQRLDVADASDATLKEFAGELARLIRAVPDDVVTTELIPLIEEGERAAELLEKLADGRISRTSFLSYVAERRWPTRVKDRIAGMNGDALRQLGRALTERAYGTLPALLSLT